MFHSTEGILLKKTKLANGGYMLKFFTQQFGLKTYFGRATKKQKNVFMPLSIASLTAYDKPNQPIHSIKEYSVNSQLRSIYQDVFKSNILIFLNEILNHVIQEEEANEVMYSYLKNQILSLEQNEFDANFHLIFLSKFTLLLGIEPSLDSNKLYFDLEDGELTNVVPVHPNFFDEKETVLFKKLYELKEEGITFSNQERKRTLQLLVTYYRYHTDMRELKSLPVLEMVFS